MDGVSFYHLSLLLFLFPSHSHEILMLDSGH